MIARLLVLFTNFVIVDSLRRNNFTVAVPGSALLEIITSNHSSDGNHIGQDLTEKSSSIIMNAHKGKKPIFKLFRSSAAKKETDPWLKITSVKSLGLCCEGHSEQRAIVLVTWHCKGNGGPLSSGKKNKQKNELPWQCRQPNIEKSSFYYESSGKNSGGDMELTWTPFKRLIGSSFGAYNKMPWETCWEHWIEISKVLYQEREKFQRFGTTSAKEMPKFTPVELIAVSYMLGGGVWEKKIGTQVAKSLRFTESLPAPAPLEMNKKNMETLTVKNMETLTGEDEESSNVGNGSFKPPPFVRASPKFNISTDCD